MKALITGANGFSASHLVKMLEARGDRTVGLVRKTSDLSRLAGCQIQLVYGDLSDRALLESTMADIDVVFHIAAYVEYGIIDVPQMEAANVVGTRNVMAAAQAAGVSKIVYCSTIGIFGDTQGRVIDETFQRQQQGYSSVYDRTKYEAQVIVDEFAAAGLPVVTVCPAGILGPDDPHFGPVLKLFLSGKLKFWVGGDRLTGVVHVDDLADAMILAAEKGGHGQKYILSAGELATREMFAIVGQDKGVAVPGDAPQWLVRILGTVLEFVGRLTGWQPPLSQERVHYIYDRCVRVDASKARQELGWQPRSVEQTIRALIP